MMETRRDGKRKGGIESEGREREGGRKLCLLYKLLLCVYLWSNVKIA